MSGDIKNNRKAYYINYSLIFLLFMGIYVFYLFYNGKTNINAVSDGMNQHYRALIYYSRYLKNIFMTLINEHRLVIPLWDLAVGEGSDIINVFHADAIGDPITFLCVFVPERYLYIFYLFSALIRIYLGGIFFSELCFYRKAGNSNSVLAGTMIYCFCFWAMKNFSLHIYFLTPFMYMPLLVLGVEKIFNDNSPFVFIIAVFLASVSWLYYFYIEAVLTAVYGIVRAVYLYRTDIKKIIIVLLKTLLYAVLGIGLAAIVLSPMIFAYMNDRRMTLAHGVDMFYSRFFYERLYAVFVGNDYPYDLHMGFASASLLALAMVFKNNRKYRFVFILDIICILFVCLPICGKVLNAFSYVSQRWSFAIAPLVAYNMTIAYEDIKNEKRFVLFCCIGILCLSLISAWSRDERGLVPVLFAFAFCAVLFVRFNDNRIKDIILIALMLINSLYITQYHLSDRGKGILSDLLSIQKARDIFYASEAYAVKTNVDETDFYRYSGYKLTNNASVIFDMHSTNYYWSITNPFDQRFRMLMDLKDRFSSSICGYDQRAELETLANVKYFIVRNLYDISIPYGFKQYASTEDYDIYQNEYSLPFGYTYRKAISYDQWNSMNSIEKQEAMMQAVVLDTDNTGTVDLDQIGYLDYSIAAEEGIVIKDKTISVDNAGSKISICYDSETGVENYLSIVGLHFEDTYGMIEDDAGSSIITFNTSAGSTESIQFLSEQHRYNFGKTDYVFYFGNDGNDRIDITFSLPGVYSFDELKVISKKMDKYETYVNDLKQDCLQDVVFDVNRISGSIDLDESKYLLLSVPYSSGFTAKVDGNDAVLLQANQHYMALDLQAGHHTIELTYRTPGLNMGLVISFISVLCLSVLIIFYRRKKVKVS